MKNILSLLAELKQLQIYLLLDDTLENLKLRGELKNLTPEIKQRLKDNKADLITFLKDQKTTSQRIQSVEKQGNYSISDAQRRLWVLSQFDEGSVAYNMPQSIYLNQEIDIDYFIKAIEATIERHEILRTVFRKEQGNDKQEGTIKQWILKKEDLGFKIDYQDFRKEKNKDNKVKSYMAADAYQLFDLENGPILRAALLQVADEKYVFYYNMHHIISDGWSTGVLANDVLAFYEAFTQNRTPNLPVLRIQYKDYSAWQLAQMKEASFANHRKYWLDKLAGNLTTLDLPSETNRPNVKTHKGKTLVTYLDENLTQKIKSYALTNEGTTFMSVVALLKSVLHRYTGQEDLILGTSAAGRNDRELENQIGFFVNALALRTQIGGENSFAEVFKNVRRTTLEAYTHQDYPFDHLVEELRGNRQTSRSAVFDLLVVFQNTGEKKKESLVTNQEIDKIQLIEEGTCIFDIKFEFQEEGDYLRFTVEYNVDLYEQELIERFIKHFKVFSELALSKTAAPIGTINYLSKHETNEITAVFTTDDVEYPKTKTIIDLFEEQVSKHQKEQAVVFENKSYSYDALNQRANQVAHFLIDEIGIEKEAKVGLLLNPGLDTIAAILGVLKAGGAYVPMDVNMPEERLSFMIADAEIAVLITEKVFIELANRLQWGVNCLQNYLCLDSDDVKEEVEHQKNAMMTQELWDHVGDKSHDLITGGGWLSSYTGLAIPGVEMDEYSMNIYNKLKDSLHAGMRVLEIGCSSGITLSKLAPEVAFYYGTDLSPAILRKTEQMIAQKGLNNVKLKHLVAHEIANIDEGDFDLIIINSVIQNFHGHNYLRKVIRATVSLLKNEGQLFIGDVMDLNKKKDLIADLERFKNDNKGKGFKTKTDFSADLFVSRGFFEDLKGDEDGIVDVAITEKIRTIENELTKFRYDVFLNVNKSVAYEQDQTQKHKRQFSRKSLDSKATNNPEVQLLPNQLAYIIYTSGTTGKPKGVLIEHQNVVRLLKTNKSPYNFNETDVWTMFHSYAFDVSVWEMYGALFFGGKLILIPKVIAQDPVAYLKLIEDAGVTVLNQTPSAFYNLSKEAEKKARAINVRYVIFAGEALNFSKLQYWNQQYPSCTLVNMYGITEVTVHTTFKEISQREIALNQSNIGQAIPSATCIILDQNKNLVPKGVRGELYVGGAGVARGYLKRDSLTTERFIPNPYLEGDILYKSGDEAKELANGDFEYFGRIDDQVKVRGYRIELGEIEFALLKNTDLDQVIIVAKENQNSENELIAYLTAQQEQSTFDLRSKLKKTLPEYMIPTHFVQLENMPLTANGKINKKGLPNPDGLGVSTGVEYIAPSSKIEKELVAIWEEVLQRKNIGIKDDFFALGGHSIKAVRLSNEYQKKLEVKLSLEQLFTYTTIAAQSTLIRAGQKEKYIAIPKVGPQKNYPISDAQRRLWVLSQFEEGSIPYNMPTLVYLKGTYDIDRFKNAISDTIDRHEILRTVFRLDEKEEIRQWVLSKEAVEVEIAYQDFRNEQNSLASLSNESTQNSVQEYIKNFSYQAFDLENGPLFRAALMQVEDEEYIFYYNMHHIISDGWSLEVLSKDVLAYYEAYTEHKAPNLKPLRMHYKDYSVWQLNRVKEASFEADRIFWLDQFAENLPVLDLPTTKFRPRIKTSNGKSLRAYFNAKKTDKLRKYSEANGGTLYIGLLACWNVLMYRYSSQNDIIIGTSIAGREHPDLENQIGFYSNTLALRNQINPEDNFDCFFESVKENTFKCFNHQTYPFIRLVEELKMQKDISRNAIFDVMLFLQNNGDKIKNHNITEDEINSITDMGYSPSKFDLNIGIQELGDIIGFNLTFNPDVYDKILMENLFRHFGQLVNALIDNPKENIDRITYISDIEKETLLKSFNANEISTSNEKSIVELFEDQALKTPDKIALQFQGKQMTYNELDKLANQLANYLSETYNIQPDDLVGIMLDRSEWMIVSILGILKSGGAYLPIEPEDSTSRKEFIMNDASIKMLITEVNFIHDMDYYEGDVFAIDVEFEPEDQRSKKLPIPTTAANLAYVIYTSGTTGKPKGVMITLKALTDYSIGVINKTNISTCESFGLVSTLAADLGNTVIYPSLLSGGTLHVIAKEDIINTTKLLAFNLDCIKMTPSHWKALQTEEHFFVPNKCLILGGESFSEEILNHLKQNNPACEVYNHYGPTETTIGKLIKKIELNQNATIISLGTPIGNNQVYILNNKELLCPIGVTGQICISGDGLAKGYLNQEQLTNEKFVENPYQTSERLYKTGDLGKWLPNGEIVFLGRIDEQVKVRGYRIELGEIEKALIKQEQINDAAVIVRENEKTDGLATENELVAYIVSKVEQNTRDLRAGLRKLLPEYMIPATFVELDVLPLTSNGKIDKNSLPDPRGLNVLSGNEYVPPRNSVEEKIIEIISYIVDRPESQISVHDNFFDIGISSLGLLKLYSSINREINSNLKVVSVFEFSTVNDLATYIIDGTNEVISLLNEGDISGEMDDMIDLM